MNNMRNALLGLIAVTFSGAANAAIIVDGNLDAAYGAAKSSVAFDANAPLGNFGAPGTTNHVTGYNIYLTEQSGSVYGFLQATGPNTPTGVGFANLYFDLNPAANNGSDLGFEITNKQAFIPGVSGYSSPLGLQFALSADGNGLEFRIPDSYFTSAISGLTYGSGLTFPGAGDKIVLRLSQSFGYSVAGGGTYGENRLGAVTLAGAVPEPSTWAMLILGFAGVGFLAYRRRNQFAAV